MSLTPREDSEMPVQSIADTNGTSSLPVPNPFASEPSTPHHSARHLPLHPRTAQHSLTSGPPPHLSRNTTSTSVSSLARETFASPPLRYSPSGDSTPAAPNSVPMSHASIPGLAGSAAQFPYHFFESDGLDGQRKEKKEPLPSCLLVGEVEKPWLDKPDKRTKISWWLTVMTACLGFLASAAVCYLGYKGVPMITQPLCLILDDEFDTFDVGNSSGHNWRHDIALGGFGNGEFEMATDSPTNSFVQDGLLYLVPTLTANAIQGGNDSVFNGYTFNLTGCTSTDNVNGRDCGAVSNATAGTIINPVMSARITTRLSKAIQFGKVEIRAKMPRGDWIWPAIWMLPVNETYGPWPQSGEIDIVESRGNDNTYPAQGNNVARSTLNWGPLEILNRAFKTYGWWSQRRTSYHDSFHTFSLEWTPDFLRTYVDSRLYRTLDLRFNEPFFDRGQFPPIIQNNSQNVAVPNPWVGRGNAAPFDQPFFLIMNVAVGGTNGWFPDNVGGKPWVDGSATAMRDFALAQDAWYPSWGTQPEDRAMVVDYVKMWQLC